MHALPVGAPAEPGPPGELPDDILATDAGLTGLPEPATAEGPADTVDETRVAELLAESPDAEVVVVDEATYEQAIADATAHAHVHPFFTFLLLPPAPGLVPLAPRPRPPRPRRARPSLGPGIEEPTMSIELESDEDSGREIPMPTVSETPTGEIPAVTDDLRAVRGIGATMERKLHGLGIVSYRQLAMLDGAELERVRAELTDFRNRIEREDWVGQARDLYREKYGRDPS